MAHALIKEIQASAAAKVAASGVDVGVSAARSQDFLYGADGLPE
jgi:hypothetical protein